MADFSSLESLQALHNDLIAFSESRLLDLERLGTQIDAHVRDFKELLDKTPRREQSRQSLTTGKIEVAGAQYSVNEEFQQGVLQVADELDLDELEAAQLFLDTQSEAQEFGRPVSLCAIIRFYQRNKYLLDSFRLILQLSTDVDQDDSLRSDLRNVVNKVVEVGSAPSSPKYARKILMAMDETKGWLQKIADKQSRASILGLGHQSEVIETIEYQRASLVRQHEILGLILFYLVKENHTNEGDFKSLLATLKKVDKYDNILLHYFPALGAYISRFGGVEGGGTMTDAKAWNDQLFTQAEHDTWMLPYVHATFRAWWMVEYSGWYVEPHDGAIASNHLEEENKQRSKQFTDALKDGAFDFMLSLSADVKSADWHDPARHGLRQWLQRKAPALMPDAVPFSDVFQEALMERLEAFIEGFITNLPDVLRKLRVEEDEQRQLSKEHEHDLDLERFIVIISYAFEGRPKAALDAFWDVPDGALMGFMHWASRRASTPLVSAFCELLQAVSEDEECATAAHEFLLDEGPQSSGKMRRTRSLTWGQIFKELSYFSAKIRDHPVLAQPQVYRPGKPPSDQAETEPESSWMLESYLRLITRLCSESSTAREFLIQHPSFHLIELLFQLASSSIQPRLRACAFTTLRSLLSQKTKDVGDSIWQALDFWTSGGYSPGSSMPRTANTNPVPLALPSINAILRAIANGFEEPNAFVQLLHALVLPYTEEDGLHDCLPFPENLGMSNRMPGIEPYVDFAVGQIFGSRVPELHDGVQQRLMQLNCLEFISTCLDTFNENLVIFANKSNVGVDAAINATNLKNYVLLHPFSRVMEWMFNDKVSSILFACLHQDPRDVGNGESDSPVVLCLVRGIHVITKVLDFQPTYLDIVRPLVKLHSGQRRNPVSNAAFASFEEVILSHLSVLSDLGLYCGTGHSELAVVSLKLLEKLSACPRIASASSSGLGTGVDRNKAIAALEEDGEAISKSLLREMDVPIDIEQGPESPSYIIKCQILDFLIACIKPSPGRPTMAHLILGLKCNYNTIDVEPGSAFSRQASLFHAILGLVLEAPVGIDNGIFSWLVTLKSKGLQLLRLLWMSPLSSDIVLTEMRASSSIFTLFLGELVIQPDILWDGEAVASSSFASQPGIICATTFLRQRAAVLQYAAAELRQVSGSHSISLKQRIFGTLMGSTLTEDGEQVENQTIFDLFDFMDFEFEQPTMPPTPAWLDDVDFSSCFELKDDSLLLCDISMTVELLALRRAELLHTQRISSQQDLALLNQQAQDLLDFLARDNAVKLFWESRLIVLRSWVQLAQVMVETGDFDNTSKASFVLRTMQTILPRLEVNLENVDEAMELARLAKGLLFGLDFTGSLQQGDIGELVGDRFSHLFQISLRAINLLGAHATLKEVFYSIIYRYLTKMSEVSGIPGMHQRHSIQSIKQAGERFIDLVCDDASSGEPMCRIAALLLLGSLVTMAKKESSGYIVESLIRSNFISILVASLQHIRKELQDTPHDDIESQLSFCHARLAVLLELSESRLGATAVMNAGLYHSIKVSGLFSTDTDLGVDIDITKATEKYHEILAAVMRVICAAVLSRGPQNEQTLELGRKFLSENRLSIIAMLKRSAGLSGATDVSEQVMNDLVDSFVLLISTTRFLEFEEKTEGKRQPLLAFT